MRPVVGILVAFMVAVVAGTAFAQPPGGRDRQGVQRQEGGGRMSGEARQRLREDLQRQHADPRRGGDPGGDERARRYAEWQRMSPAQREGVRRELHDANRDFDRRR